MGIGNGWMPYECYETVPEYSPESHMISEGMEGVSASYQVPNHEQYDAEEAATVSTIRVTDIINKLTP